MADIGLTKKNLEAHGFIVTVFDTLEEAANYLDSQIDGTTVGISGSVTIQKMKDFGDRISRHNAVCWHWYNAVDTHNAIASEVYITSANAVSETGEIVNIVGRGNRASSNIFGHERLYYVMGENKIMPDLEKAVWRARNVAAPLNVRRMAEIRKKNGKPALGLPCVEMEARCYDCDHPNRECKGLLIEWRKPGFITRGEVLIVKEDAGL